MSTHTGITEQSFLKDYGVAIGAVALGLVAVVVGLAWSFVIGGLLGLVTWMIAAGARSMANSNDGKGYGIAIAGAVLGALAVVMMIAGNFIS